MRIVKNQTDSESSIIHIDTRGKWFNWILIFLCFFFLLGVRLQVNRTLTGDEPHYIAMDYALVHYHDLNLYKVYEDNLYTSWFPYPGVLQPQNPQLNIHPQKVYSTHGIGLPLFLTPGFWLDAKNGAVFEMVVLATAVVWLTWVWTNIVTKNRKVAYLAAFLLTICYFFNGLTGAMYPDMLIAAITLTVLIMLERYYKKLLHHFWIGLLLGFLILVHIKNLYIVLPALLVLSYKSWKAQRKIPWITFLIVAAFAIYFFVTFHKWFGVWNVSSAYGTIGTDFKNDPLVIGAAQLFDSTRGLLVYNPIILLLFVGLPLWFKKQRETFVVALVVLLPSIGALSIYNGWHGGQAPLGRYIIDFLPALIPAIAFTIIRMKSIWQRVCIALLAVITFLITLDSTLMKFPLVPGGLNHPPRSVLFTQIQNHTGLVLDKLLPSYSTNVTTIIGHHGLIKTVIGYCVVLVLMLYGYILSISTQKSLVGAKNRIIPRWRS